MSLSKPSKILFQMTGSIACFKACQVISKLAQAGHDVQVVASPSALQFVGNATIEGLTRKPVISDLFSSGNVMDHIHLVRWADLIIVAPATANFVNKIAQGIGDDLLTTQFLAHDFKKPYLLAPAMNTSMYLHPVTQKSIQTLKSLGVEILETASGVLACGEVGWGRLLEPDLIVQEIEKRLGGVSAGAQTPEKTKARKILVTSGGTQEPIDQVRVLSNKSTGTTGARISDTLSELGYDVTYLHAENAVKPRNSCRLESFTSFQDLEKTLRLLLESGDYSAVVHAAAVSDYSILSIDSNQGSQAASATGKISSEQAEVSLKLKKNPKLINQLREMAKNPKLKVVAFKMTATDSGTERQIAVDKVFNQSKADLVVHNDMAEMDWKTGKHLFHVHQQGQQIRDFENKESLSAFLGEYLSQDILGGAR